MSIACYVLQRGWVMIGQSSQEDGPDIILEHALCIRRWGTQSLGLGALHAGPLESTVLDYYGTITIPTASVIFRFPHWDQTAWKTVIDAKTPQP
jgi:hypothetical protein